jgi:hypothetical protein
VTSNEPVLRAVRTQVQFELAQAAAEVADATARSGQARQQAAALAQRCDAVARGIRDAMNEEPMNPALLQAMRRAYHSEHIALRDWQARLSVAGQREEQARIVLAGLRNRDRSLERALQAERVKRDRRRQAQEMVLADETWLQHTSRQWS